MKKLPNRSILLIFVVLLCANDAYSGTLDDFEREYKRPNPSDSSNRRESSSSVDSCIGDFVGDIFFDMVEHLIVSGGAMSLARVTSPPLSEEDEPTKERKAGEALIPFVRLDVTYRKVDSDIDSRDDFVEVGYGPIAIIYSNAHYEEENPKDTLDIESRHLLYRMSIESEAEIDLGFGEVIAKGDQRTAKISVTLPVRIHPNKIWGVELRPVWAEAYKEYDAGLLIVGPYSSLKMGYRSVRSRGQSLSGPYIGISLRY